MLGWICLFYVCLVMFCVCLICLFVFITFCLTIFVGRTRRYKSMQFMSHDWETVKTVSHETVRNMTGNSSLKLFKLTLIEIVLKQPEMFYFSLYSMLGNKHKYVTSPTCDILVPIFHIGVHLGNVKFVVHHNHL